MKLTTSLLLLAITLCLLDTVVGLKKFCKNSGKWQEPNSKCSRNGTSRPGRHRRPGKGGCSCGSKTGRDDNDKPEGPGDKSPVEPPFDRIPVRPRPPNDWTRPIWRPVDTSIWGQLPEHEVALSEEKLRKPRDVASATTDVTESVEFLIRNSGGDPTAIIDGTELIVVVDDDVKEKNVDAVDKVDQNEETRTKRDVAKKIFGTEGIASAEENADQPVMVLFAAPEDIIEAHFPPNVDFKELHYLLNDEKFFDSPSETEEMLYENFLNDLRKEK